MGGRITPDTTMGAVARALYRLHYATRAAVPHRNSLRHSQPSPRVKRKTVETLVESQWAPCAQSTPKNTLQESPLAQRVTTEAHHVHPQHFLPGRPPQRASTGQNTSTASLPSKSTSTNRSPKGLHCFPSVCWRGKLHVSTTFVARRRGCDFSFHFT